MLKNVSNSKPTGRRVPHVIAASMLLAVVGTAAAASNRGPDDRDNRDRASGMVRMQQMGRPAQSAPAPVPAARPSPAPVHSAPMPQAAPMTRSAPMPQQQASAPTQQQHITVAPSAPGAPIMHVRSPQDIPVSHPQNQPPEQHQAPAQGSVPPRVVPQATASGIAPSVWLRPAENRGQTSSQQPVLGSSIAAAQTQSRRAVQPQENAPVSRLRAPQGGLPETTVAPQRQTTVVAGRTTPSGTVAHISTDRLAPGAPISRLRAPEGITRMPSVPTFGAPSMNIDLEVEVLW